MSKHSNFRYNNVVMPFSGNVNGKTRDVKRIKRRANTRVRLAKLKMRLKRWSIPIAILVIASIIWPDVRLITVAGVEAVVLLGGSFWLFVKILFWFSKKDQRPGGGMDSTDYDNGYEDGYFESHHDDGNLF
ncbi:hypothetical protein GCM10022296_25010 [Secundilactobacillus similis DSM 23365 = JCM 2765]|nr:hypothetical protein [Secundilactobacillus similis]